jgi:hypothetical protein
MTVLHLPVCAAGSRFATETVRASDAVALPAVSYATAERVCVPSAAAAVSHDTAYGAVVSLAPRSAPSRRNCTAAMPWSSVASAATVTIPDNSAPLLGADSVITGGVTSGMTVVKDTGCASVPSICE